MHGHGFFLVEGFQLAIKISVEQGFLPLQDSGRLVQEFLGKSLPLGFQCIIGNDFGG